MSTKSFFAPNSSKETVWIWNESRIGELSKSLLETGFESDVTLFVGEMKQKMVAHKIILKMRSKFFYKTLQENNVSALNVPCEPEDFRMLLKFFYTGSFGWNTDQAILLMRLSYKFEVPSLLLECEKHFDNYLDNSNAVEIYSQAVQYKNFRLLENSLSYICKSAKDVLFSSEIIPDQPNNNILALSSEALLEIIKQDKLEIANELSVFRIAYEWAKEQCRKNGFDEKQSENLEPYFKPLLPHIRFTLMDKDDFVLQVVSKNLLSQEDMLCIMMQFLVSEEKRKMIPSGKFSAKPRKGQIRKVVFCIEMKNEHLHSKTGYAHPDVWKAKYIRLGQSIKFSVINPQTLHLKGVTLSLPMICRSCSATANGNQFSNPVNCEVWFSGNQQRFAVSAKPICDPQRPNTFTIDFNNPLSSGTSYTLEVLALLLGNQPCQACGLSMEYSRNNQTFAYAPSLSFYTDYRSPFQEAQMSKRLIEGNAEIEYEDLHRLANVTTAVGLFGMVKMICELHMEL